MEKNIAPREFLKSVLREYKKDNSQDAKNQVYELLEREKQYIDSRKFDEERIEELEEENAVLKEEIKQLSGKKHLAQNKTDDKERNPSDSVLKIKEKIEELEQICFFLEEKGMTKPLKSAEAKLNNLRKRLEKI